MLDYSHVSEHSNIPQLVADWLGSPTEWACQDESGWKGRGHITDRHDGGAAWCDYQIRPEYEKSKYKPNEKKHTRGIHSATP